MIVVNGMAHGGARRRCHRWRDDSSWAVAPGMHNSASRLAARRQPAPKERELPDRSQPRSSIGTLLHGVDVLHVAACDFIQASLRYCVHLELRTRHADPRIDTSAWRRAPPHPRYRYMKLEKAKQGNLNGRIKLSTHTHTFKVLRKKRHGSSNLQEYPSISPLPIAFLRCQLPAERWMDTPANSMNRVEEPYSCKCVCVCVLKCTS